MTPKFSLVIGIVAAALVLAAPAVGMVPTLDGGDSGYAPSASSTVIFDNYKADGVPHGAGHGLRFDNYRVDTAPVSQPTVGASDSGRDWPELGIGFAFGIVALLGVLLVMRHTRIRPLAH